jgi:hypothetical protein
MFATCSVGFHQVLIVAAFDWELKELTAGPESGRQAANQRIR